MANSDSIPSEPRQFPTHAAYLVPVEIKDIPQCGVGQTGVFAAERIAEGTRLWAWTHRVASMHRKDLSSYTEKNFGSDR